MAVLFGCANLNTPGSATAVSAVSVTRDGDVMGRMEREIRKIPDGREVITRQTLRLHVDGRRTRTLVEETRRTEDANSTTVAVRQRSSLGRFESVTTAEIAGTAAIVRRDSPSGSREQILELPDGLRFDNGAGLLQGHLLSDLPDLEFYALDVRAPLIERIVYRPAESAANDQLLRLAYADGTLRSVSRLFFDSAGTLLRSEQPLFGSGVVTSSDPESAADQAMPMNPVLGSLVKSPYRISREALQGHIRYTFGMPADIAFEPPETSEQRVVAEPGTLIIDVCKTCGPGLDSDVDSLTSALQPTFWLQSDHPLLQSIGSAIRETDLTDSEKMERLEQWARERMQSIDFVGHFSAADALMRQAGDCTEGAVVLAALGRSAGIPTRVASGIVYSREQYHGVSNVFMPHAWTLAFVDGQWKSFDMSLDGFDASHIALSISDGDPGSIQSGHQLAALLQWDEMTEVRSKPAAGN